MTEHAAKEPLNTEGGEAPPQGGGNPSRGGRLITHLGVLRLFLAAMVLICLPMVFFASGEGRGWNTVPAYVAPVLVILMVWLLLFDMLMAAVLMGEHQGRARDRYKTILRIDTVLLVALLLFWGPFFIILFS